MKRIHHKMKFSENATTIASSFFMGPIIFLTNNILLLKQYESIRMDLYELNQ